MRLFNNTLLKNSLSNIYIYMFNEMSKGFDKIVVNSDEELKIAEDLTKFLCIYSHVTITKKS